MNLKDRHDRASDLFRRALGLPESERDEFLRGECGADRSLREEVRELLLADAVGGPVESAAGTMSVFAGAETIGATTGSSPVAAGDTIGEFRLLERVGRGGMGEVWVAEQASMSRRVALKLIRAERVNEKAHALFSREARAGGRLSHPGLVEIHGHGESNGIAWISMELIEGGWTLRDALDKVARADQLPEDYYRHVAELAMKLADAMHAAHSAGVIHRDLKPQNILITADGEPRVTDFGLARIADESALSATGDVVGTYYYMSPEQVAARRAGIDHRTDVFSLGVVLYEMLALRRPFAGDTAHQVAQQILFEDPPDLRGLRSRMPHDLAVITTKAIEKAPDRRYASMAEMAADIRRHLAHEPILARPPAWLPRLVLLARRNPAKSVGVAIGTAAMVVISGLLVESARANRDLEAERGKLASEIKSVTRLSAILDHERLIAEAGRLWPAHPDSIGAFEDWIADARRLVAELPTHIAKRAELRSLAIPRSNAQVWEFPSTAEGRHAQWWHGNLMKLIGSLESLEAGPLSDAEGAVSIHGWSVPRRLALAERLRDGIAEGGEWSARWEAAIRAIREHEAYAGLAIEPQVGLVPIGPDPRSGLWEFWHVATGDEPVRENGKIVMTEDTGLVLVLIPGRAAPSEAVAPAITSLSPFFLSKYEMHQGQLQHFTGEVSRGFVDGAVLGETTITRTHPIRGLSWDQCAVLLERLGLWFPTQAQWEYAAQAGAATTWPTGETYDSLQEHANLFDEAGYELTQIPGEPVGWNDGYPMTAPVDAFSPNRFGLHNMYGNVWERCAKDEDAAEMDDDRPHLGGSYTNVLIAPNVRGNLPSYSTNYASILGLRPARDLAQ